MICNGVTQMSEFEYQNAAVQGNYLLLYMSVPLETSGLDIAKGKFLTTPAGFSNTVQ